MHVPQEIIILCVTVKYQFYIFMMRYPPHAHVIWLDILNALSMLIGATLSEIHYKWSTVSSCLFDWLIYWLIDMSSLMWLKAVQVQTDIISNELMLHWELIMRNMWAYNSSVNNTTKYE